MTKKKSCSLNGNKNGTQVRESRMNELHCLARYLLSRSASSVLCRNKQLQKISKN